MESIAQSAAQFFARFPESHKIGRTSTLAEFEALPPKIRKNFPQWYKELMLSYPLVGLRIGVPSDYGQEQVMQLPKDRLPLMDIIPFSFDEIAELATDYFPGYVLWEEKYLPIAGDDNGAGDGIFISCKAKDPAPIHVFHDFGDTFAELIEAADTLAESFSDFFASAHILNKDREIPQHILGECRVVIQTIAEQLEKVTLTQPDRVSESWNKSEKALHEALLKKIQNHLDLSEISQLIADLPFWLEDLSFENHASIWKQLHDLYGISRFHKGDLYYIEATWMR